MGKTLGKGKKIGREKRKGKTKDKKGERTIKTVNLFVVTLLEGKAGRLKKGGEREDSESIYCHNMQ